MLTKVFSAALRGVDALEVEIEVNGGPGDPQIIVVGLPDASVRESRDRVITAIGNSGFRWPRSRMTVNLAPANVKKEGPSFDLPIALGMLAVEDGVDIPRLARCMVAGELGLTGEVRAVKGVLPIALEARRRRKKALIVPLANAAEAAVVEGVQVFGVRSLREAYEIICDRSSATPVLPMLDDAKARLAEIADVDFSEVKGQNQVKRAIEVAVAGNHNLMLIGPPGSGKSMLSKRIATIMPPMSLEEAIETTKIHSICGLLNEDRNFVFSRPFRSPHHTISDVGLLGGSSNPTPGEVSLAHNGVLFLDELPEFKRSTLEVMRQPLEDAYVVVTRVAGTMKFPADFMLVAAMNPCPCGYFGDLKRECRCSPTQVERYRQRISGPLLDRIDIHVDAPAVAYAELSSDVPAESSANIRERVEAARAVQTVRYAASRTRSNARMSHAALKAHCRLDLQSQEMLRLAMADLELSARAYDRILKVSRTIADLAESETIKSKHLAEAIQYRTLDRNLWR